MSAKKITATLAALSIAAFTSCNAVTPPAPQVRADSLEYDYTTNVEITPNDARADLEANFGGKVVIFEPEQGFAVLGFNNTDDMAQALNANPKLERNKGVFLGGGKMAWMNGSVSAWAGGSVSAWAGGSVSAWAGGSVSAWAGGNYTFVPQNSFKWRQIRLEQSQRYATNLGNGVKVAVIDTGIDLKHPAFVGAILQTEAWDFVGNDAIPQEEGTLGVGAYGHGTNVAGIILQIAPRAKILPLRVLGTDGSGDVTRVAAAINYAVNKGAQVINLSLGSEDKSAVVQSAIDAAAKKGVIVIASSGNTGDRNVTFPASDAYADRTAGLYSISVGSVNASDLKSTFSTYGDTKKPLEIVAPGELVYAPAPDNRMAAWSGTSMAAPMVSGALALALGQPLKVSKLDLLEKLRVTATDIYNNNMNSAYKDMLGKGRLNIELFLVDTIVR
jgi:thermitase